MGKKKHSPLWNSCFHTVCSMLLSIYAEQPWNQKVLSRGKDHRWLAETLYWCSSSHVFEVNRVQSFFRQLLPVVKTNEEQHPMSCDWNPTKCFAHKLNFHAWKIKTFRDQDCLMVILKSWKFGNQISSASFSQSRVSQYMRQNFKQFYLYFLAQCPMSSYHM